MRHGSASRACAIRCQVHIEVIARISAEIEVGVPLSTPFAHTSQASLIVLTGALRRQRPLLGGRGGCVDDLLSSSLGLGTVTHLAALALNVRLPAATALLAVTRVARNSLRWCIVRLIGLHHMGFLFKVLGLWLS